MILLKKNMKNKISIHAAQEGCDFNRGGNPTLAVIFQSTQPKRAATADFPPFYVGNGYFNPRSPRGLRQLIHKELAKVAPISIHAAQEGCDQLQALYKTAEVISIHAAQEGCDREADHC